MPSARHSWQLGLPKVEQQSKREFRPSSAPSTSASVYRLPVCRAPRPHRGLHPRSGSFRNLLALQLPIPLGTPDSAPAQVRSHAIPFISQLAPPTSPPLRVRP